MLRGFACRRDKGLGDRGWGLDAYVQQPMPNAENRAIVLANPRARLAGTAIWREAAIAELSRRYATELVEPRDARHTTALAREAAAESIAVVAAAGGDGTINAVARGLAGTR